MSEAKITEADVQAVVEYARGLPSTKYAVTTREIARETGVLKQRVQRIVKQVKDKPGSVFSGETIDSRPTQYLIDHDQTGGTD